MNKNLPGQITAYLTKRAEQKWLNYNSESKYKLIIVIPAIKESENLPNVLNSLNESIIPEGISILVMVVINNSEDSPAEVIEDNVKSIEYLNQIKNSDQLKFDIDYINVSTNGNALPVKDAGVGLVRKIGMDQALLYLNYNHSSPGLVFLDADCTVEQNYLVEIVQHFKESKHSAAVIKYRHKLENDAIVAYETFLRYYVLGLKYAESPYAHHSIGSCIVIDPFTYVKIGGMNKKKAGEDFYFLEKAAKLMKIKNVNSTTVYPSARKSWRVPFGTGKSITRYYNEEKNEYILYDPHTFVILKKFLSSYSTSDSADEILHFSKNTSNVLHAFLSEVKLKENFEKILINSKTEEQIINQKKIWFDGFKTMKLIHFLRDNGYPHMHMFTALNDMFDLLEVKFDKYTGDDIPSKEKQIEYLSKLRELT